MATVVQAVTLRPDSWIGAHAKLDSGVRLLSFGPVLHERRQPANPFIDSVAVRGLNGACRCGECVWSVSS